MSPTEAPFGFDVHVVPWDFGSFRVPADRFGEQQAVSAVGICDEEFAACFSRKPEKKSGGQANDLSILHMYDIYIYIYILYIYIYIHDVYEIARKKRNMIV